ncbi:hypothetical protein T484DRAFT_1885600, partial [Baffinella frigidus]
GLQRGIPPRANVPPPLAPLLPLPPPLARAPVLPLRGARSRAPPRIPPHPPSLRRGALRRRPFRGGPAFSFASVARGGRAGCVGGGGISVAAPVVALTAGGDGEFVRGSPLAGPPRAHRHVKWRGGWRHASRLCKLVRRWGPRT